MKQLYTYLLLLTCCLWVSCSKSDDKSNTYEVNMSVTALGELKEYTLKDFANSIDEITIQSTQPSWASIELETNTNNEVVVIVMVDENDEEAERTHQVSLKAENGHIFLLNITQKAPLFFEKTLDFAGQGGQHALTLENFTPPVVSTEGLDDWLEIEWKSETSRDIIVTAKANPSATERTAQITLKDSLGNHTILHVSQTVMKDNSDDTTEQTTDQEAL